MTDANPTTNTKLQELVANAERYKVKRRLKRAFARKNKPSIIKIVDDIVPVEENDRMVEDIAHNIVETKEGV